jgi:S-adenosylmethionine hydrolase
VSNITIVDISHQVAPFNIQQAAFILRNCYFEFPKGTVHIVAVNAAISKNKPLLVLQCNGHFFLTTDNGIPGLLFSEPVDDVYRIPTEKKDGGTFASLTRYVDVATALLSGTGPDKLGEKIDTFTVQVPFRPVIDNNMINGSVIYIDSFSNAITNISKEIFQRVGKERTFEILVQSNHYKIMRINNTYTESASGDLLALFNSIGLLEVAICNGNAAELLNLKMGSTIRVKFYKKEEQPSLLLKGE